MFALKTLLPYAILAISAAAAPSSSAAIITAQTLITDIKNIDKGVNNVRAGLANYNGSALTETPIFTGFTEIEVANRKGYADANLRTTPFSAADSRKIVQSVIDTVGVDIPASVKELEGKKPYLQASGQDALIKGTLEILLYDHDSFSAAVAKSLTADLPAANKVVAKIHNAIQGGIDFFSS